jgi:phenylpyruvate tautomerase PptA (4-oxalocrotonate tautomerase family)
MPVIQIRALPQREGVDVKKALAALCAAVAEVYGCESAHVWATWQCIEPGRYVEGGSGAGLQPEDTHPPIVDILCFEGRSPELIESLLERAAEVLSRELGIPGNVFITYTEARSGRVFTGGGVRRG